MCMVGIIELRWNCMIAENMQKFEILIIIIIIIIIIMWPALRKGTLAHKYLFSNNGWNVKKSAFVQFSTF